MYAAYAGYTLGISITNLLSNVVAANTNEVKPRQHRREYEWGYGGQ